MVRSAAQRAQTPAPQPLRLPYLNTRLGNFGYLWGTWYIGVVDSVAPQHSAAPPVLQYCNTTIRPCSLASQVQDQARRHLCGGVFQPLVWSTSCPVVSQVQEAISNFDGRIYYDGFKKILVAH